VRANEQNNGDMIKDLLIEQVTGSVRWRESIEFMSSKGVSEVFEIGAGKALSFPLDLELWLQFWD
jgi:[acyl-carrier-protein] S-malonyltransferase